MLIITMAAMGATSEIEATNPKAGSRQKKWRIFTCLRGHLTMRTGDSGQEVGKLVEMFKPFKVFGLNVFVCVCVCVVLNVFCCVIVFLDLFKVFFSLATMVNHHQTTIWGNIFGTFSKHLTCKSKQ